MDSLRKSVHGFTLIEVAVVLFIITLVMSGIVSFVNASLANRQIEVTKTKQEAIKTALITFIARNYRLPCPALATLPESDAYEGVEAVPSGGGCTGIIASGSSPNQVVTGTIPWVSLGLTRESSLDAYANRYTYQVALGATSLTSSTVSGMTGRITVHSAGPGTLGAAPTGNQINDCSAGATVNPCAAVAVIVSHGKDGYGAYTRSGTRFPFDSSVTGNDAKENAFDLSDATKPPDSKFVVKDYSGNETNPFDDIVMVLTTNDLLSPLILSGNMKDYSGRLSTTFNLIQAVIVASAVNNRTGSAGSRSYPLPDASAVCCTVGDLLTSAQMADPWGTTITYSKAQNFITVSDPSNGEAFRLVSYGPDKSPGGGDDIPLIVTAGDLQSVLQLSGW